MADVACSPWESSASLGPLRPGRRRHAACGGWRQKRCYAAVTSAVFMASAWSHSATPVRSGRAECESWTGARAERAEMEPSEGRKGRVGAQ